MTTTQDRIDFLTKSIIEQDERKCKFWNYYSETDNKEKQNAICKDINEIEKYLEEMAKERRELCQKYNLQPSESCYVAVR